MRDSDSLLFAVLLTLAGPVQCIVLFAFPNFLREQLERKMKPPQFGGAMTKDMREKLGPEFTTLEVYALWLHTTPDRVWKLFQWLGAAMSLAFSIAGVVLLSRRLWSH